MEIRFKRLDTIKLIDDTSMPIDKDSVELPKYAHDGDIGLDVKAVYVEYDVEHDQYIYHTGLACESDFDIAVFGLCRSSNCKTDAYLTNGVGLIDSAIYRGEIQFRYKNRDSLNTLMFKTAVCDHLNNLTGNIPFAAYYLKLEGEFIKNALNFAPYKVGERIGQFVPMNVEKASIVEVDTLKPSVRGDKGFGSTGK